MRVKPKRGQRQSVGTFARGRRGRSSRSWDPDEVAAHLMGCHDEIVRGLGRQSPWAGMDEDTLDSCFHHAAAFISEIAAAGQRPDWRSPEDLERAQVTAFRHQALDHWKRVNAVSRRADRTAVEFDPERHIAGHEPMDRLFERADLPTFERDLLAELSDKGLREFWAIVIGDQVTFKVAGDRLGMNKAAVMASTRAGRSIFAGYLARREDGTLCRERGLDIAARRSGKATLQQRERATAHLEGCYACALVHEPSTNAFDRGILGLAPTGLILRLVARMGDASSVPALRFAESGSGSRAVAAGLAAVSVAGAGIGVGVSQGEREPAPRKPTRPSVAAKAQPLKAALRAPAPPAIARASAPTPTPVARATKESKPKQKVKQSSSVGSALTNSRRQNSAPVAVPSNPAVREFGVEAPSPSPPSRAPAPRIPTASPPSPTNEFATP